MNERYAIVICIRRGCVKYIAKFDLDKCGAQQRAKCYERNEFLKKKYEAVNGTPIYRIEHEYQLKTRHGKGTYAQAAQGKLVQFPLRLYYASTAHKLQVRTLMVLLF